MRTTMIGFKGRFFKTNDFLRRIFREKISRYRLKKIYQKSVILQICVKMNNLHIFNLKCILCISVCNFSSVYG